MKILHAVENYYPSIGGMQEVVKQISERLVKLGHDVTVATSKHENRNDHVINGVKIIDFDITGNIVCGMSGEVENYRKFMLDSEFDVITNFAAQQWSTDIILPILNQIKGKKVFVPTGFSLLYSPDYNDYYNLMKKWMLQYDANVFLSNDYRDINFAREIGAKNLLLIPNGADENEFLTKQNIDIRVQLGIQANDFLIITVGSHTGAKGHKEAIKIFRKAKIKDATLLIIGNYFEINHKRTLVSYIKRIISFVFDLNVYGCKESCKTKEQLFKFSLRMRIQHKKLIITSLNRESTVAAYQSAQLFLFPSNIECSPIVLFECMASKTPFLSSDVGNAKEIVSWTPAGMILPTTINEKGLSKVNIEESVAILENIYEDKPGRNEMAENGHAIWQKSFTWKAIAKEYELLYTNLTK